MTILKSIGKYEHKHIHLCTHSPPPTHTHIHEDINGSLFVNHHRIQSSINVAGLEEQFTIRPVTNYAMQIHITIVSRNHWI